MYTMKPDTKRDYTERVQRVLVYIQRHLGESPGLDELARIACFSPFHFHRVFRGAFACSPTEFRAAAATSPWIDSPAGVHLAEGGDASGFQPIHYEESSMQIEVKKLAPTKVAFVRHVGPYHEVGQTWERLCDWAGKHCLFGPEVRFLGASYDDPEITPPGRTSIPALRRAWSSTSTTRTPRIRRTCSPKSGYRSRKGPRAPERERGGDHGRDQLRESRSLHAAQGRVRPGEEAGIDQARYLAVDGVGGTGEASEQFCAEQGLKPHLWQHQIYLNDPRRLAPEKLKTILHHPVR